MKTITLAGLLLFVTTLVLGQTNTGPLTPLPPVDLTHTSISTFWTLAIATATPIIVALARMVVPKLPKVTLAASTPFVGILIGLVLNWLGSTHLNWVDMAQAGAMGVAIREIWNNAVTKQLNPPTTPETST